MDSSLNEDSIEEQTQSICSIIISNQVLGYACFEEITNQIYVDSISFSLEDAEDSFTSIKQSFSPTLFLVHSKMVSNIPLLEALLMKSNGELDENDKYEYQTIKSSSWSNCSVESICQRLVIGKKSDIRQRYNEIISKIDLESLQLDEGIVCVSDLKPMQLIPYMKLDSESFKALQIFSEETHPNMVKGRQHSKEGFSLFSLLDRTQSLPGRQKLKEWMKKPICDLTKLKLRQMAIALFLDPKNNEVVIDLSRQLRHVHDLRKILLRIRKVEAIRTDWQRMQTALQASLSILETLLRFERELDTRKSEKLEDGDETLDEDIVIREIIQSVPIQIPKDMLDLFYSAFDFKFLEEDSSVVSIRVGFDQELDDLRRVYDGLEVVLATAAQRILDQVPLLSNVSVEYFPQIGYLVSVNREEVKFLDIKNSRGKDCEWIADHLGRDGDLNGIDEEMDVITQQMEMFEFVFRQGDTFYFKHNVVIGMDDEIGDIRSAIIDRQKKILLEIEEIVLDAEPTLQLLSVSLASLDALVSLATIAKELDFVQPDIVDSGVVVIKNGRHPLQELTVDSFIPNDTFLSLEKNVAVITGPNNSGKSVYLKQVGVLVYLAHIGSWLPCEKAVIGLIDRIFTRVTSIETATSPQSSFSIDCSQVNKMLHHSTHRSLCLLDEFGKGTSPVDGLSLLAATIRFFAERNTKVLDGKMMEPHHLEKILIFRMDIHKEEEQVGINLALSEEVTKSTTPLFKLKKGICVSSEAIPCALNAGVPKSILERANEIKASIEQSKSIIPLEKKSEKGAKAIENQALLKTFLQLQDWRKSNEEELAKLKMSLW